MSQTKKIINDFKDGLSMIGLARKYKLTNIKIQNIIRKYMRKYNKGK